MKKLITMLDIKEKLSTGSKEIYIDDDTIITPAAQDAAKEQGIKLIKGAAIKVEDCCASATCAAPANLQDIDSSLVAKIVREVMSTMGGMFPQSLVKEVDPSGFMLIKGNSVQMGPFNDGKVDREGIGIKEVTEIKESKNMTAGFMTFENSNLTWTLTYDEFDYVVEGTLEFIVNGKTYTGEPGDVFYIPADTTVTFSTPNKTKFFFVTYPANWQELCGLS